MAVRRLSRKHRLIATIVISFAFFITEITVGFLTRSLALIADAFHYFNDLIGLLVALAALHVSEREDAPPLLSYGWHRASTLGAFFNGVFLLALGMSVLLQSIERFISIEKVENPFLMLVVGGTGLGLNLISILFLHEHEHHHGHSHSHSGHGHGHDHGRRHMDSDSVSLQEVECGRPVVVGQPAGDVNKGLSLFHRHHFEHKHTSTNVEISGHDLGMLGVLLHVIGDAVNNIGVMVAAVIIWKTNGESRFYADPAVGLFIAIMIIISSWPLVKHSGYILLQGAPGSLKLADIQHDMEKVPGIESVHELHVWRLDQHKVIASAHVVVSDKSMCNFMEKAKTIGECLHAYGIHSATLQPELVACGRMSGMIGEAEAAAVVMAETEAAEATEEPKKGIRAAGPITAATESPVTVAAVQVHGNHAVRIEPGNRGDHDIESQAGPGATTGSSAAVAGHQANTTTRSRKLRPNQCQLVCGSVCEMLTCCTRGRDDTGHVAGDAKDAIGIAMVTA